MRIRVSAFRNCLILFEMPRIAVTSLSIPEYSVNNRTLHGSDFVIGCPGADKRPDDSITNVSSKLLRKTLRLCLKLRSRNFFEKKFLENLQKTFNKGY